MISFLKRKKEKARIGLVLTTFRFILFFLSFLFLFLQLYDP